LGDPHETFTLSFSDARLKAREILDQSANGGYLAIVENWRQLPDGRSSSQWLIGSIRRECIDHIVLGQRHLRHVLLSYAHRFVIEQRRANITRRRDSRMHSLSPDSGRTAP